MQLRSSKKTHYLWRYVQIKFVTNGYTVALGFACLGKQGASGPQWALGVMTGSTGSHGV